MSIPMCQGFSHFPAYLYHFVLAKLATSNIRVNAVGGQLVNAAPSFDWRGTVPPEMGGHPLAH